VKAILTDDGVLTITGNGAMDNYTYNLDIVNTPWWNERQDIVRVEIESGVTAIGDQAFENCSNLISVTIQGNVGTIGYEAFYDCNSLETVTIQGNVGTIGDYAFSNCNSLETVTIEGNVGTISKNAFGWCISLETVTIEGNVGTIGTQVFYDCGNLETVTIPGDAETIGYEAFENCSNLTSVTVTGGLVGDGKPITGGVIDKYFKNGTDWKLPGMSSSDPTPIKSLTLKDIGSSDYDPNNKDDKGGIEGDTGRELHYSDAEYEWDGTKWYLVSCSVSGTLTVTGGSEDNIGVTVSIGTSELYTAVTDANGDYEITKVPGGTEEYITAEIDGYRQTLSPRISSPASALKNQNITLTALYTVTLTTDTGISGFEYTVNGDSTETYTEPFKTEHGDSLTVTALLKEGYGFKVWSEDYESEDNPLTVPPVTEAVSLTAYASLIPVPPSSPDMYYSIAFDYDPDCTVYANGSPVSLSSSPLTVTYNGELTFTVNTPEGYAVYPVISGTADITLQADGRYKISDIRSDIRVTVSVSADGGDGSDGIGSGSGNMSGSTGGNGSGNYTDSAGGGNSGSDGDSYNGVSSWVPAIAVAVFLACIGIAWMFLFFLKRRKDDEEEDGN
jgi:hypothetical protein